MSAKVYPIAVPSTAFYDPSDQEAQLNPEYWAGYAQGERASVILPSPIGSNDYWGWRAVVSNYEENPSTSGEGINNFAVGFNGALLDAALYIWLNDPNSPHNVLS